MSYPNKKNIALGKQKPPIKAALSDLSPTWKDAIFNHEDCKKVFDERITEVRLPESEDSRLLIYYFKTLLPELSDNALNLSDKDGEYDQLIDVLQHSPKKGIYTTHPGIFILMVNHLRKNAGKFYAKNLLERKNCFHACENVLNAIRDLQTPIRDKCIEEFYENITEDQRDDVKAVVKRIEDPRNAPMPGNQGIPQFRGM